jgi:DNA repair exonuclease SbcCD ATPase subunit
MADEQKPLHIVELRSSNVKRLRAVRVRPDGAPVVLIGGENGQGKSSLLDSIEMALAGKRSIPLEPVRHGAREAEVELDLGEFKVERTITAKGSELIVRDRDGVPQASPQTLLDKLTSKVTFDPLAFMRMDTDKQDALLKKMIGLDFSDIEKKRAIAYEQRTKANHEVDRLKALFKSSAFDPAGPSELVDVAALTEKLQVHRNAVGARQALVAAIDGKRARLQEKQDQVARVQRQLTELLRECTELGDHITSEEAKLPPAPAPIDDVQEKLRTAEATNANVRARQEHKKLATELDAAETKARDLDDAIKDLDQQKAERLASAKFPIEGLGFDDAGPIFNGVPIAQASQAEQLRVSVAIGAAQHPRIRVMLVREGSRLDKNSLALLAELARETDSQVWVERVSDGDPGAIIIEDGLVKAPVAEVKAGAA